VRRLAARKEQARDDTPQRRPAAAASWSAPTASPLLPQRGGGAGAGGAQVARSGVGRAGADGAQVARSGVGGAGADRAQVARSGVGGLDPRRGSIDLPCPSPNPAGPRRRAKEAARRRQGTTPAAVARRRSRRPHPQRRWRRDDCDGAVEDGPWGGRERRLPDERNRDDNISLPPLSSTAEGSPAWPSWPFPSGREPTTAKDERGVGCVCWKP
jgi:hypothetical protein